MAESLERMPHSYGQQTASFRGNAKKGQAVSWLLDTDVLCQPVKTRGDRNVIFWLEREQDKCYTSTIVIAQIAYWIRTKSGRARANLEQWLRRSVEALDGRILSFNTTTAHVWADQKYLFENAGMPMPLEDSYIAATARRHDLTIVTGNDKHFRRPGLKVFNPFKDCANGGV
jgi:toxin FitB